VTYVATWSGFADVAFVTDVYSRRIVGWNLASTLRSDVLPLQVLDMAAWAAGGRLDGLIHHADHGSNYLALVHTDRIVELVAKPSTGTVGDSLDNALAEAVTGSTRPSSSASAALGAPSSTVWSTDEVPSGPCLKWSDGWLS